MLVNLQSIYLVQRLRCGTKYFLTIKYILRKYSNITYKTVHKYVIINLPLTLHWYSTVKSTNHHRKRIMVFRTIEYICIHNIFWKIAVCFLPCFTYYAFWHFPLQGKQCAEKTIIGFHCNSVQKEQYYKSFLQNYILILK